MPILLTEPPIRTAEKQPSMLLALQTRILRRLSALTPSTQPSHLETGIQGEREALLHLRKSGYIVVASRWKNAKLRGDADLIAWHDSVLCFIEVKTRTREDIASAEASIDADKQETLRKFARAYLRRFPQKLQAQVTVRFDVVTVHLLPSGTEIDLHQNAFGW